jgi:hypothetical protein
VFELTMPTGHRHTIHPEPQPISQWPKNEPPESDKASGHELTT